MSQVYIENITENHRYKYGDAAKDTVALSVIDGMEIYHVMMDGSNLFVANQYDEFIGDDEVYNKVRGYVNEWIAKGVANNEEGENNDN